MRLDVQLCDTPILATPSCIHYALWMTPSRFRQPNKTPNSFPLVTRLPRHQRQTAEPEEDLHPDSDASLLRKHYSHEDEDFDGENTNPIPSFLQRVVALMSQTPLLQKSSNPQDADYGSLPHHDLNISADVSDTGEEDFDDVRRRDKRERKSSALPYTDSVQSSSSRRSTDGNTSARHFRKRSSSGLYLNTEEDDNRDDIMNIAGRADAWGDDNPKDNSPSVLFLLPELAKVCNPVILFGAFQSEAPLKYFCSRRRRSSSLVLSLCRPPARLPVMLCTCLFSEGG